MAEVEEQISLAEEAESLAQRYALQELALLEKLRKVVEAESVTRLRSAIREFAMLESDLWRANQNAIAQILILKKAMPSDVRALTVLEKQMSDAATKFFNLAGVQGGALYTQIAADKPDFKVLTAIITAAESSLREWIQSIKSLQDEFRVTKAAYEKALPQVKITDLLTGKGYYAKYELKQRRDLWNRWVQTLKQRNLAGINLEKTNLSGFNFSGFQLQKANLKDADLTGVNFTGANLKGAVLPFLNQVTLNNAVLRNTNIVYKLLNVTAINADFSGSAFSPNLVIERCDFHGSKFNGTSFAVAYSVYFLIVNLSGASFVNANLSAVNLKEVNLANADLRRANLEKALFYDTDVSGAKFNNANLLNADFTNCIIGKGAFSAVQMKQIKVDKKTKFV